MKQINGWQQSVAVTPLLSLAVTAFATPSNTANKATAQGTKPSDPESMPYQNEGKSQQDPANCRRVVTSGSDLVVRSSPDGPVIGSLPNKSHVMIENRSNNGWVRISSPLKGYVSAGYLKLCAEPVPPSKTETPSDNDNYIRRVVAPGGLRIRKEPSLDSLVVGYLADGQRIKIASRGANGWVPIASPVSGYVSADYLKFK